MSLCPSLEASSPCADMEGTYLNAGAVLISRRDATAQSMVDTENMQHLRVSRTDMFHHPEPTHACVWMLQGCPTQPPEQGSGSHGPAVQVAEDASDQEEESSGVCVVVGTVPGSWLCQRNKRGCAANNAGSWLSAERMDTGSKTWAVRVAYSVGPDDLVVEEKQDDLIW